MDGFGDFVCIQRINQECGVARYLGHGRHVGSNHRTAASHGLQNRQAETFHQRHIEITTGATIKVPQVFITDIAA